MKYILCISMLFLCPITNADDSDRSRIRRLDSTIARIEALNRRLRHHRQGVPTAGTYEARAAHARARNRTIPKIDEDLIARARRAKNRRDGRILSPLGRMSDREIAIRFGPILKPRRGEIVFNRGGYGSRDMVILGPVSEEVRAKIKAESKARREARRARAKAKAKAKASN